MKQYSIRIISEITQLPASTLRYYEKIGLLEDVERGKNGLRIYNEVHLQHLKSIKCFKDCGMPLKEICKFYKYENNLEGNIEEILDLILNSEKELSDRINEMQEQLLHIQHKKRYYQGIKHAIVHHEKWKRFEDYA